MSGPGATAAPSLTGCVLRSLDGEACERHLAWLLGEADPPASAEAKGLRWVLAHGDDGVTWGRHDVAANVWRLGNQVAPDVSPPICREALQELRLFGEAGEVLIWRTDGGLRGRVLLDAGRGAAPSSESDPLSPSDEPRILRGDHVLKQHEHGFSHIGDRAGAEQVLPLAVTTEQLRAGRVQLAVRHYYESDVHTGAVRIAATRLVTLEVGGGHGA